MLYPVNWAIMHLLHSWQDLHRTKSIVKKFLSKLYVEIQQNNMHWVDHDWSPFHCARRRAYL